MKATELRIGNLVHHETWGDSVMEVIGIDNYRVHLESEDCYIADFDLEKTTGILIFPLTEDWLKKFNVKQHGMNRFEVISTGFLLECTYEVKYIHQLQNLYFALTGEELTLKQ